MRAAAIFPWVAGIPWVVGPLVASGGLLQIFEHLTPTAVIADVFEAVRHHAIPILVVLSGALIGLCVPLMRRLREESEVR